MMAAGGPRQSIVLMVLFVVLWMVVELIAATLLAAYTAYQVVWARYGVHLALMAALWGWRDAGSLVRTQRRGYHLARSGLMLVMPVAWYLGTQAGVPLDTTMALFWLAPLFMLAGATFYLGERFSPLALGLSVLAWVGAWIFHAPRPFAGHVLWLLAPLAMGGSFALYVLMTRRLRDEPVRVNLFYTALAVFVLLTPVMPFVWVTPSAGDWARLAAVGLIGYLGLWALDRAVAGAPVAVIAPLCFLLLPVQVVILLAMGAAGMNARTAAVALLASAPLLLWWLAARPAPSPTPLAQEST